MDTSFVTKEFIEKLIGKPVEDYKVEVESSRTVSIKVIPVQTPESISISMTILPSSE